MDLNEFLGSPYSDGMELKFKKLHPEAVLPSYANPGDGAMDLTSVTEGVLVSEGEYGTDNFFYYIEYDTGLAVEIPNGYVGLLFQRSSVSKKSLSLANAVGLIDFGYSQSVKFRFKAVQDFSHLESLNRYNKGDRIGQIMVVPRPKLIPVWTEELSSKDRGGGFGSSGT